MLTLDAAVFAQEPEDKIEPAVYVVDCDPATRAETVTALSGLPWPVYSYESPAALFAVVHPPSGCVVANISLVGMTLEDFLAALETDRHKLALILLSRDIEVPQAVAAMRAGVHDVLELPVAERLLRRQVRAAIASIASYH